MLKHVSIKYQEIQRFAGSDKSRMLFFVLLINVKIPTKYCFIYFVFQGVKIVVSSREFVVFLEVGSREGVGMASVNCHYLIE